MANLILPGAFLGVGGPDFVLTSKVYMDSVGLTDSSEASLRIMQSASLALGDVIGIGFLQLELSGSDTLSLEDAIQKVVLDFLTETLSLTDASTLGTHIEHLLDSLGLADSIQAQVHATLVMQELLGLHDALGFRGVLSVVELVELTDSVASRVRAIMEVADSLVLTDSIGATFSAILSVNDSVELEDTSSWTIQQVLAVSDTISLVGLFRAGDAEYVAWLVNAATGGPYKWTGVDFNSMGQLGGKTWFCAEDGLYRLAGEDDSSILPVLRSGLFNFEDGERELPGEVLKGMAGAFLLFSSQGETLLKVTINRNGQYQQHWYKMKEKSEGLRKRKMPISKTLRSVLWQFELCPLQGKPAEFREVEVLPLFLTRRT